MFKLYNKSSLFILTFEKVPQLAQRTNEVTVFVNTGLERQVMLCTVCQDDSYMCLSSKTDS